MSYGRITAVRATAAAKRRLYRRFLQWTGKPTYCGGHAEKLVEATLLQLKGSALWVPESARTGRVRSLLGRPVEVGGPLDAAGAWSIDPENPSSGFVPFAVEVKNTRGMIYPWANEMWDLLSKLAAFPDVVPVLVARRIHPMSFNMFKDIGALGVQLNDQLFSPAIAPADFDRVCAGLRFHNARQISLDAKVPQLTTFFGQTGPRYGHAYLDRWAQVAPIAAQFGALRDPELPPKERKRLWVLFAGLVQTAGLYDRGGWAPRDTAFTKYLDYPEFAEWEEDEGENGEPV